MSTKSREICISLSLLAIVYCLPYHFTLTTGECQLINPADDHQMATIEQPTRLRMDENYVQVYQTLMYLLFVTGGPLIATLIMTLIIVRVLRRNEFTSAEQQRHRRNECGFDFQRKLLFFLQPVATRL